jgi:membrane protein
VTPENNPQRPTQHLEYEPIKKMETEPEKPPGNASKALGTVTSMAEKVSASHDCAPDTRHRTL